MKGRYAWLVGALSVLLAGVLLLGCTPVSGAPSLTLEMLQNAEYPSPYTANGKARLVGGKYEEPLKSDPTKKVSIELYPSFALGDLNDDGQEDAAALLLTTTGGEEVFVDLVGVRNQYGLPLPLSSVTLGDRVHVDWMVIQNGEILLDLTAQGPNDAPCCPTQKERHVYRLLGDKLAKVAITVVKTPTPTRPWRPFPTSPVGAVWEWTEYQDQAGGSDIVVDEPARYTLEMAPDGTYNLRADCNNRVGEYTLKGSSLSIGAGQGPRINCGQGSLSDQYLDLLSDVSSFVLKDGVLSLVLKMDAGQMLFRPAE